jgi:hypothetical protein
MTTLEGAESPVDRGSLWKGVGLLALLHLIQIPLIPLLFSWMFISLSQLVYVVPAAIILRRKGRPDTARGVWIGAGITALLNAICFGVLCAPMMR